VADTQKKLPVYESYYAWQGEGIYMGRAAYFVRLHGCDSVGTMCRQTPDEIVAQMVQKAHKGAFLCITGNDEPALHKLDPLIKCARAAGFKSHIETAGHRPLPRSVDWITLSPRLDYAPPLLENIVRANEFKITVENAEGLQVALDAILPHCGKRAAVWLHPEWSLRDNAEVLNLISSTVKSNPRVRAGWRLHKLYPCSREAHSGK
jgi:7-carboxy-7-deazaguanine synthase